VHHLLSLNLFLKLLNKKTPSLKHYLSSLFCQKIRCYVVQKMNTRHLFLCFFANKTLSSNLFLCFSTNKRP